MMASMRPARMRRFWHGAHGAFSPVVAGRLLLSAPTAATARPVVDLRHLSVREVRVCDDCLGSTGRRRCPGPPRAPPPLARPLRSRSPAPSGSHHAARAWSHWAGSRCSPRPPYTPPALRAPDPPRPRRRKRCASGALPPLASPTSPHHCTPRRQRTCSPGAPPVSRRAAIAWPAWSAWLAWPATGRPRHCPAQRRRQRRPSLGRRWWGRKASSRLGAAGASNVAKRTKHEQRCVDLHTISSLCRTGCTLAFRKARERRGHARESKAQTLESANPSAEPGRASSCFTRSIGRPPTAAPAAAPACS